MKKVDQKYQMQNMIPFLARVSLTAPDVTKCSAFLIASEDPCTSDLTIIFSSSDEESLNAESCVTNVNGFLHSFFS